MAPGPIDRWPLAHILLPFLHYPPAELRIAYISARRLYLEVLRYVNGTIGDSPT